MSEIVEIGDRHKRLTPEEVLAMASREKWSDILIFGWHDDGEFRYIPSNTSNAELNWLIDRMKKELHEGLNEDK